MNSEKHSQLSSPPPALVGEGVTVRFDDYVALDDVSLVARAGEVDAIFGPNGAGKTTLFKAILGLVPLAGGRVLIHGGSVRYSRARIAYVPQRADVDWTFPVSVLDVVLMGVTIRRGWLRRITAADRRAAIAALERVGMDASVNVPVAELSGGQQQRVLLARAICQGGDILALDEPFAGVDTGATQVIEQILRQLAREGRLILFSTHDLEQAAQLCDRVLLLNRQAIAFDRPERALRPEMLRQAYNAQVFVLDDHRHDAVSDHHPGAAR